MSDRTAELERMVKELSDELEQEIKDRYEDLHGFIHPALMGKYRRDMAVVEEARALLAGEKIE
jgi:hypothetical protein